MIFQPGTYYVGDPGFVLPNDDLRMLFSWSMDNNLKTGPKTLESSYRIEDGNPKWDMYWIAVTPHKRGSVYDKENKAWGFDWKCFGVVPWEWLNTGGDYFENKIEFTEPFECLANDDSITIGHLQFTFNQK